MQEQRQDQSRNDPAREARCRIPVNILKLSGDHRVIKLWRASPDFNREADEPAIYRLSGEKPDGAFQGSRIQVGHVAGYPSCDRWRRGDWSVCRFHSALWNKDTAF